MSPVHDAFIVGRRVAFLLDFIADGIFDEKPFIYPDTWELWEEFKNRDKIPAPQTTDEIFALASRNQVMIIRQLCYAVKELERLDNGLIAQRLRDAAIEMSLVVKALENYVDLPVGLDADDTAFFEEMFLSEVHAPPIDMKHSLEDEPEEPSEPPTPDEMLHYVKIQKKVLKRAMRLFEGPLRIAREKLTDAANRIGELENESCILRPKELERVFQRSWKTIRVWFKKGLVSHIALNSGDYRVDASALPPDWKRRLGV